MASGTASKSPLEIVLIAFGTKAEIARRTGAKPMTVQQWFRRKHIPEKWLSPIIETSDGQLTLQQLRPELFENAA